MAVLALDSDPDECARWAANAPLTEGVLTPFGVLDPATLSQSGRIDAILALERVKAWADANRPGCWPPRPPTRNRCRHRRASASTTRSSRSGRNWPVRCAGPST